MGHTDLFIVIGLIGSFILVLCLFGIFFFRSYLEYKQSLEKEVFYREPEMCPEPTAPSELLNPVSSEPVDSFECIPVQRRSYGIIGTIRSWTELLKRPEPIDPEAQSAAAAADSAPLKSLPPYSKQSIQSGLKNLIKHLHKQENEQQVREQDDLSTLLKDDAYSPIRLIHGSAQPSVSAVLYDPTDDISLPTYNRARYTEEELLNIEKDLENLDGNEGKMLTALLPLPVGTGRDSIISNLKDIYLDMCMEASAKLAIIRFLSYSAANEFEKPSVFLRGYALIVDELVNSGLVVATFKEDAMMGTCIMEVLAMYCVQNWFYNSVTHYDVTFTFDKWAMKPYIPDRSTVYQLVLTLLKTGLSTATLLQLLDQFSAEIPTMETIYKLRRLEKQLPDLPEVAEAVSHIREKTDAADRQRRAKRKLKLKPRSLPGTIVNRVKSMKSI